ncbi:MAG: 3-oxoacyl-[acyl-carrier-protein] reductase [Bacteroidota bacterium]
MELLQGSNALVTGGARGIGRAITAELLADGARVAVLDRSFPDDFEPFAETHRAAGRTVQAVTADVTDTAGTEAACEAVLREFGTIDILVNNAGITRDKLLPRMTEEEWDSVLKVNLKGAFNTMRVVARAMMRQRRGKIINISSVVGLIGNVGQANYAASKAGLFGLTKSVAKELAGRNVNVNCVAPGFVETEMTAALTPDQREALLGQIPFRRTSRPEEIAGIVAFLASEKAAYITGQIIAVDGGMTM